MAKCDIDITFDRPDRTYRGGERVAGEVRIRVNQDVNCHEILLTHFWKTHGRGNTAQGTKHEIRLAGPTALQAGQALQFPFEFEAERTPLTYHGHLINVDHYVHVGVDIPWAFDPKQEEEYLVLPGERPLGMSGSLRTWVDKNAQTKKTGKLILVGAVVVFLLVFSIFFIVLLPLVLIGGACYWGWKQMIASRVGKVEIHTPHTIVGSGESWPIEMRFTPKKSFAINGITVKISAKETAISGSGTNRSTHRHALFSVSHTLHEAVTLVAGEPISKRFVLEFPTTDLWSLDASDNDVEWFAEVRIDMPGFPDWTRQVALQVVPIEFLDLVESSNDPQAVILAEGVEASGSAWLSSPVVVASPLAADRQAIDPPVDPGVVDEISVEAVAVTAEVEATTARDDTEPLLALVQAIAQAGRFSNERSERIAEAAGQHYDTAIVIDRIVSTFGFADASNRYEQGRTVVGQLVGTDQAVQLFAVDTSNEALDDLSRGATWRTRATVLKWDALYERLVMKEVSRS